MLSSIILSSKLSWGLTKGLYAPVGQREISSLSESVLQRAQPAGYNQILKASLAGATVSL